MPKAAFHNLGCKVNAYETEAMQQLLEAAGYQIVPFHEKADVYLINTCSVTNMADRKSRQMLHKAKKQRPFERSMNWPVKAGTMQKRLSISLLPAGSSQNYR